MKWPSRRPFLLKADIVIYYTGIEQTKVKNHSVHWGHLPPPSPQKHHSLFLVKPPLNLQNVQAQPF